VDVPIGARADIARCAATADGGAIGLEALEGLCPGLEAALMQLGLTSALIDGASERLDTAALGALLNVTRQAAQRGPDPARLAAVMQDLRGTPGPTSAWQRFKDWFARTFLSRRAGGSFTWLEQWLERLTPGKLALELLVWGLLIGVVGAAVFVIVRELRAAAPSWWHPLRRREVSATADASPFPSAEDDDWRRHPLPQRPALLFRHVARRLGAAGRLPALGGHTHRELTQQARFDADGERDAWQALARAAERQIYAPHGVTEEEAGPAVDAAERWWAPRP
jgi:hypothetical protein